MSRQLYVTPRRLAELRSELSDEAWAVLLDVQTMRVAGASDLQALHELRQDLSSRQFRNLLKQLTDWQVLARLDRTIGGRRAGSSGFVYVVGTAGQRLLAAETAAPVRRAWTPRPAWLAHALAVSHLYLGVRQVERDDPIRLHRFEAEPACWRPLPGDRWLKPDAFVEITGCGFTDAYFVEVDCGTESTTTLATKFGRYGEAWRVAVDSREAIFPLVLWLAPNERRREVIESVRQRLESSLQQLHRTALYGEWPGLLADEPP